MSGRTLASCTGRVLGAGRDWTTPHRLDETWQLLEDFSDAARLMQANGSRQGEVLPELCELAVKVSGADHASVTSLRGGSFATVAATSDVPVQVDGMQYATGQGPCVDAVTQATTFRVDELATDRRWPRFGSRAVTEAGMHSMVSHVLPVDDTAVAAINVYAARPRASTPELETVISLLGAIATAMLRADREEGRAQSLEQALRTSRRIGMALGILMANTRATPDEAWESLSRESMNRNIKVSTLAEQVIRTGTFDARAGD